MTHHSPNSPTSMEFRRLLNSGADDEEVRVLAAAIFAVATVGRADTPPGTAKIESSQRCQDCRGRMRPRCLYLHRL